MADWILTNTNANGWQSGEMYTADLPAPTVLANGIAGDHWRNWWLYPSDRAPAPAATMTDKPPYRVPLMTEIRALPWNGLTVASTFSGGGGSCTGYAIAGYRVAWANEFNEAARAIYKLNHPKSQLDATDIRELRGKDVLAALDLDRGQLDLLDGSPPCQSFSSVGRREEHWGKSVAHGDGTTQRSDDLFFEYARLLRELEPRVFVAENVEGLIRGTARGYYNQISAALSGAGYVVECRLLNAKWLDVPQNRPRVIFVGVRRDLVERHGVRPAFPRPRPWLYSLREAMAGLPGWEDERRKVVHDNKGRFQSGGTITDRPSTAITIGRGSQNASHYQVVDPPPVQLGTYAIGDEWDKLGPGQKSDRFLNLVKPDPAQPCPAVTATGGAFPGGACVTHPHERRKFTIAELRRVCAFPDDYQLVGDYGEQWARLGNAVPPLMMAHVAAALREQVFRPLGLATGKVGAWPV